MSLPAILIPIVGSVLKEVLAKKEIAPATPRGDLIAAEIAETVTAEVMRRVQASPEAKNALNAESPLQSRVVWGSVVSALGVLLPIVAPWIGLPAITGDQVVEIAGAIVTLGGALYALYGRLKGGLKPLFSRG